MKRAISASMVLALAWTTSAFAKLGDQDDSVADTIRTTKALHATIRRIGTSGARTHEFDVNGARIRMEVNSSGKVCEVISSGPNSASYIQDLLHTGHQAEFLAHDNSSAKPPAKIVASRTLAHFHQDRETPSLKISINRHSSFHRISIKLRDADCGG